MDTTTSIKMTTLAIQNLFGYVEEENLAALKAHLDRFKEVDGRSDVRQRVHTPKLPFTQSCRFLRPPHSFLFVCLWTERADSSHAGSRAGQPGDRPGAHQERSQRQPGRRGEPLCSCASSAEVARRQTIQWLVSIVKCVCDVRTAGRL